MCAPEREQSVRYRTKGPVALADQLEQRTASYTAIKSGSSLSYSFFTTA